ncbi:hypothetical protein J5277_11955 [Rhizobium sp. 16-449-1b]|uniref:hypothetical protein n=1 Tax=Rhizobium sp. 16-449-1b TaxID=2819989 RepID=UPI001ADD217B|nr:hypothetical protein [Rhizobium sp. 16-449-1b]MBO9194822.1 hypothetical protein [Rhizobium sp. 16-449-1b]
MSQTAEVQSIAPRDLVVTQTNVVLGAIAFSLYYFGYAYFYQFEDGFSHAPAYVKSIKDALYALVLAYLVSTFRWHRLDRRHLLFVPFLVALIVTSAVHAPHTGLKNQLIENIKNVALYIPIFCVALTWDQDESKEFVKRFFALLTTTAILQFAISAALSVNNIYLWTDKLWVGLIINPNSFAMVMNFAAAIWLARIGKSRSSLALALLTVFLSGYVAIRAASSSQIVILPFLIVYFCIIQRAFLWRYVAAIAVFIFAVELANDDIRNVLVPLLGLTDLVEGLFPGLPKTLHPVQASLSILNRQRDFALVMDNLGEPINILLGAFNNNSYVPMDGQFQVLFYNGGLLSLLTFSFAALYAYIKTFVKTWMAPRNSEDLALHGMITILGITMLVTRIVMYFPFNLIFFLICGLALGRAAADQK